MRRSNICIIEILEGENSEQEWIEAMFGENSCEFSKTNAIYRFKKLYVPQAVSVQ